MVQLDARIVHAETAQRGEQVFDRLDRRLVGDETRLELLASGEMRHVRRNLGPVEIGTLKADAVVGGRGFEGECDLLAGVEADPGAVDHSAKGALSCHQ